MSFTFKQILGYVVFKTDYFISLQVESKRKSDLLQEENTALKKKLEDNKMFQRVEYYRDVAKLEEAEKQLLKRDFENKILELKNVIKQKDISIKSSGYLLKDMLKMMDSLDKNYQTEKLKHKVEYIEVEKEEEKVDVQLKIVVEHLFTKVDIKV
jgi:hypothetical protein